MALIKVQVHFTHFQNKTSAFCVNSERNLSPANWLSTYFFLFTRHISWAFPLCRQGPHFTFPFPRMPLSSGLLSLKHPPDLPTPASGLYFFLVSPFSTSIGPPVTRTMYQASLRTIIYWAIAGDTHTAASC